MTQDHADERAFRAMGEAQRTQEFKEARSTLIGDIQKLHEAYKLGMANTWGNFRIGKSDFGTPAILVDHTEDGSKTERVIGFDELAFKQYEDGQNYEHKGQTDIVASFEDETFNERTRQFERIGWTVRGDGAVERLLGEEKDGQYWRVGKTTNDVMDLQMAHEFLQGVIQNTVLPETQAS